MTSRETQSSSDLARVRVIVWRELRIMARRKRTYVFRVLYAGSLVIAAFVLGQGLLGGSRDWSTEQLAWLGIRFYSAFGGISVLLITVLAPAFTAGAVAQEKERSTLSLLLTTQLTPAQLILGKLASRILTLFILITAGIPVLATCMLLGGVGILDILILVANLYAIAIFCASVGLLFSVICSRTHTALLATYMCLVGYTIIVPFALDWMFQGRSLDWNEWVNPLAIVGLLTGNDLRYVGLSVLFNLSPELDLKPIPFCLFASFLSLKGAILLLPRCASREPHSRWRPLLEWIDAFFAWMNRGRWSLRFRSDLGAGNPVAWKERRYRVLGNTDNLIRFSYLLIVALGTFYGLVTFSNSPLWTRRAFSGVMVGTLGALWYLALSILAASSIAAEKDRATWDLLLTTRLSGWQILWGKIFGTVRASLIFLALPLIHLVVSGIVHSAHYETKVIVWMAGALFTSMSLQILFSALTWFAFRNLPFSLLACVGIGLSFNLFMVYWVFQPWLGMSHVWPAAYFVWIWSLVQLGVGVWAWFSTKSAFKAIAWTLIAGLGYSFSFNKNPGMLVTVIFVLLIGGLFHIAVGTYSSLRAKSFLQALLCTLGVALAVNVILPLFLVSMSGHGDYWLLSPVACLVEYVEQDNFRHSAFQFDFSLLWPMPIFFGITLSLGLLAWMTLRFDRLARR